jgi:hypothetical protein
MYNPGVRISHVSRHPSLTRNARIDRAAHYSLQALINPFPSLCSVAHRQAPGVGARVGHPRGHLPPPQQQGPARDQVSKPLSV